MLWNEPQRADSVTLTPHTDNSPVMLSLLHGGFLSFCILWRLIKPHIYPRWLAQASAQSNKVGWNLNSCFIGKLTPFWLGCAQYHVGVAEIMQYSHTRGGWVRRFQSPLWCYLWKLCVWTPVEPFIYWTTRHPQAELPSGDIKWCTISAVMRKVLHNSRHMWCVTFSTQTHAKNHSLYTCTVPTERCNSERNKGHSYCWWSVCRSSN